MASPVVDTAISDQSGEELTSVNLDVSGNFSDTDVTDSLTYSIASGLTVSTGFTIDPVTGVFSGTPTEDDVNNAPLTVVIRAEDESANSTELTIRLELPPTPTTEFVNSRNISGVVQNSASNYLHDSTKPVYLLTRTANLTLFQPRDLFQPSSRSRWIDEFEHINYINPLGLMILHQAPMNNVPGYRTKKSQKWGPYTEYAQALTNRDGGIDRKDAMLSVDGTDNNLLQTNSQSSTTNKAKQAGWQYRVTNSQMRRYLSDVAIDCLTGSNRSGYGVGGGNAANFMIFWYDGIDINTPKTGAALRRVAASGTVDSILENKTSNPKQPIQVRIDDDPAFATTGNLPAYSDPPANTKPTGYDTSYGATDEVHALWFYPPTGTTGFLGLHVIGYKAASGGKADLYLKQLDDRYAHDNQFHEPEAGWKYCLNTQASGYSNADHDGDGVNLDRYTVESWAHATAVKEHFDEISAGILEENGTNTMRSGNAFSSSNTVKRSNGLPHPSAYDNMWDIGHNESVNGNFKFDPDGASTYTPGEFHCDNTNIGRGMKAMYWCSNCIRDNQGGWMQDKPRGSFLEIDVSGETDYSVLDEIDAVYARFFWALQLTVPNSFLVIRQGDSTQYPCMLEEHFIDLNTNYSTPAPLGTYDPAGGGDGSAGHPIGSWDWATGGAGDFTTDDANGKRIYIRRVGNWLVAINCANAPSGYNTYAPTHLSSDYTPRDPEDIITPAEFAQLVTDGVLDSGYTLTHYDPASYHNQRVTDALISRSPDVWTGFQWGPDKAHPDDANNGLSDYTLANAPFILRDRTLNDGSTVNTSANYTLGPLEAVIWKVS